MRLAAKKPFGSGLDIRLFAAEEFNKIQAAHRGPPVSFQP
jgi:hypothetical protein